MALGAIFRPKNDVSALQVEEPLPRQRYPVTTPAAVIALISSTVALGLFAAATAKTNNNFENANTYTGDWTDALCLVPAGLSMISSAVFLSIRGSNPKTWQRLLLLGFIPFLVVAACVPSLLFAIAGAMFQYLRATVTPSNNGVPSAFDCANEYNAFTYECAPVAFTIARIEIAGIVFLFIVFLSNFVIMTAAIFGSCTKRKVTYAETKEERANSAAS